MEIYLIRHAQTARNKEKLLQGRSNAPLNEAGREQSRQAGEFFRKKGIRFDRIYSSPLIRCVQTAGILMKISDCGMEEGADMADESSAVNKSCAGNGIDMEDDCEIRPSDSPDSRIITDERLLEMDYGPYEGMSLQNPPPEIIHFFSDFVHNKEPEGMESLLSVKERLKGFLMSIKDEPCEHVLIATHAIALKGALEVLTPEAGGFYWSKNIGNCAVYHTSLTDGKFRIPTEFFSLGAEAGV